MTKQSIIGEVVAETVLIERGYAAYDEQTQEAVATSSDTLNPADVAQVTKEITERAGTMSSSHYDKVAVIASALEQTHSIVEGETFDAQHFLHDAIVSAARQVHRQRRANSIASKSAMRFVNLYSDEYYARRLDV